MDNVTRNHQDRIDLFMEKVGQELPNEPVTPSLEVRKLRATLILEECMETIGALGFIVKGGVLVEDGECNIVEVADGCADISVVTIGTLSAFGIDAEPLLALVDASNLAKFGPGGHRREDGKWVKPADWVPPNIIQLLRDQGYHG